MHLNCKGRERDESRMRTGIGLILILLAACSCNLSQLSNQAPRDDSFTLYGEYREERSSQEMAELVREGSREKVSDERANAGLQRYARCPRCYRRVGLAATSKEGDEVRCGNCGRTFVLELKPKAEAAPF